MLIAPPTMAAFALHLLHIYVRLTGIRSRLLRIKYVMQAQRSLSAGDSPFEANDGDVMDAVKAG
jgi:hypothetical protein